MTDIEKRLKALESKLKLSPLRVIAENDKGEQIETTVSKCIAHGLDFVRVVRGSNLRELDELLSYLIGT